MQLNIWGSLFSRLIKSNQTLTHIPDLDNAKVEIRGYAAMGVSHLYLFSGSEPEEVKEERPAPYLITKNN